MRTGSVRLALLILVSMALAACGQGGGHKASGQPQKAGYIVVKAQPYTVVNELPGRTDAYQIAQVRPQVNGIIEKRLFTEGDTVKAGQPLYQIDDKLYKAQVENAKANLASAEANLKTVRLKADRYKKLIKRQLISQQDYDDAQAALGQAQAQVSGAKASLDTARINLGYTTIRAPISGKIGRSQVTAGALVTANQSTALATIRQLNPIYVDVTQSFDQLRKLRQAMASGQLKQVGDGKAKVGLVLADGSHYDHDGTLQFSEYNVDESTGSVTLRAIFPNPNHDLLPGMFVRARLPQGEKANAIMVPQKAIAIQPNGSASALVIGAGNKVEKHSVTTERSVNGDWLISKGLKVGDKLIVDGLQKIHPGMTVTPVKESPKSPGQSQGNAASDNGQSADSQGD